MLLGSTVWGLCKLLLFMYPCIYQIVYQKSLKKLSPFHCCLAARSSNCSSCPIPPSCASPGAQGLVEENGSRAIPAASPAFGLKARGFKKLKIQPFPSSGVCRRPEGATSLLQLLLLGAVLEEGALGGTGVPQTVLTQAPALGPPQSGAGGFGFIRTFQPPEIKHLF